MMPGVVWPGFHSGFTSMRSSFPAPSPAFVVCFLDNHRSDGGGGGGGEWNLKIVLICVALMAGDVEHFVFLLLRSVCLF